ncbi:FAD-dependent oxidoreductase [Desulfoglaeba alkanexedens]|uniref:Pyridine nucleotide-disulfide oxidoreductase n=1 Tax=Desulfoglaeba alkanexedens ALDC TaxID=980445 RepID=A0A4V1ERL0_9BACT|nr:FAD-dependent oxidoreductase [Desulfoglaeba alkanexedens]QCQ22011.1 pyridine nucleotide-disulfide oxidoreductase [Desulfoglaeba alkanexedens ALDC]
MRDDLKVLVIGGVACGPKAASRLKRLMPHADVTLIERDDVVSYGACGLPYYVEGVFSDVAMLTETPVRVPRTPVFFETVKGIRVLTRTEAVAIDRNRKIVRVREGNTGTESELAYDKLVLATGARPFIPPVEGVDLEHVWTIRRLEDAVTLTEAIEKKGLKKAVLVGAGYIGIEMAEALVERGLEVTLVDMFDQVMPQFLDRDMALLVEKHLQPNGVKLVLGEKVTALEGDHGVLRRVRTEKQTLEADLAIIAVGVRPNDSLARDAKIQCAPQGGIVINSYCQTSDPDIYAGGDCVVNQYVHPIIGTPLFIPLGSTANKHGRVIANHIAGLPSPFPGVTSTGICRIFDITVGRTGLTEKLAQELNLDVETVIWSGPDRPHYIPEQRPMVIKMIACKRYRKLLGLQVVGPGDGAKRLDVAATAIFFGATLDQIGGIDLAYAPPYGPPIDPIATTAHVLLNKMNGLAHGISPLEAKRIMDDGADVVLLDVRTPDEFRETRLEDPRVVHIPLGALRKRLQELPKDKEILAFCKVSMRGYEAQRILNAAGYDRVRFIEGGLLAWPFA